MSLPFLNSEPQKTQAVDWARLIPGGVSPFRTGEKKRVQPARPFESGKVSPIVSAVSPSTPESAFRLLLPSLLYSRAAPAWMFSLVTDFALVALNWLFIGALEVPLREFFPSVRLFRYAAGAPVSLLGIALLHAGLITLMGYAEGHRTGHFDEQRQARILGRSVLWATLLLCAAYGLQGAPWPTSVLFCGAGGLHFGSLWAWRWQSARQRHRPSHLRNVLIVGAGSVGRQVAAYIEEHPDTGRTVSGFLDDQRALTNKVIGRVEDLARLARTGFVDEVILAAPRDRELILQVLREGRRLRLDVEIVPDLFGCKPSVGFESVGDLPLICLHAERMPAAGLVLKRAVDVIGAGLALMLLAPALAVIAALIKLDSPGSVFYCAQRAGRKGRLFRCYKFRTMVSNADVLKDRLRGNNERSGPFFKMAGDPRITRLGRFLRRYSLDELPQLWNVLKRDMSLVGPRPHPLDDVAAYQIEHLARLDVTPGITGLWQISARRDPSFQRGMELDREYIRTWSVKADMRILLRTFLAVARGSGD